jgi:SAM-dependent methyltransferase
MAGSTSDRIRAYYDRTAREYDASIRTLERILLADGRAWAASQARGEVLELGVGTGRNLAYYPRGIRLVGVDVSQVMLAVARERAHELQVDIDLRQADAESLPFDTASFDTVVSTLALCSMSVDRLAIQELARVLRPDGCAVLVEHVRSPLWPVRFIELVLDPLTVRFQEDHLLRDPLDHLPSAGFDIQFCERSKLGIMERLIARKSSRQ